MKFQFFEFRKSAFIYFLLLFVTFIDGADPWGERKKLLSSDSQSKDYFGYSVSISEDIVIVGAFKEDAVGFDTGAAYIFSRDQGGINNWGEIKKLIASDAQEYEYFGCSVSISGNIVIIGAWEEDSGGLNAGAAYIFSRDQGGINNWGEVKKLMANDSQSGDWFGFSVSISGDIGIVGAFYEDSGASDAGVAYIFSKDQGGINNWGQVKKLIASDIEQSDRFGYSVSISGDTLIIGAHYQDSGAPDGGAAYIFSKDQGGINNWGQVKKLIASDSQSSDHFGYSVSILGDVCIIGAVGEDSGGPRAGAAYIFSRDQEGINNWGQVKKLIASDSQSFDKFGYSVSISGDISIIGAYGVSGGSNAGAAYIFSKDHGGINNWGEIKKLIASDSQSSDRFGQSVSISGNVGISGAYYEDSVGIDAGAAYIFEKKTIIQPSPSPSSISSPSPSPNNEIIVSAIVGTLIVSGLVIGGVIVMKRKNISLGENELKKSPSQIGLFQSSQELEKDGIQRRGRRRRLRRKPV